MLTSVSETTYPTSNTSTASVYSVGGGVLDAPLETDNFAKSILGNNCKKVDITANGVLNVGDDDLATPNMNTYSMNSTTNSSTLFSMEVDAIGNMTKFNGYDFNWNGRRLESISQDGVELISYKYNIDGQRVSKTVGGTTTEYFYNGDILAGQKTGNDVLIFMYDNNDDVFGFTYNGTPYYYIKNAQNDVYMIVDETGVAQVLYMYDAWGRIGCYDATDFGLATINPLMYRSYYLDVETGYFFYYLNSRYYLADLGRFVSADSYVQTGQGMLDKNMFAYCGNNPVMFRDPSGCSYEITIPAVGNGPVTVTTDNGNTYSYNIPKKGNTYYFDEKQFKKDLINNKVTQIDKKVTQVLEPIVQVTGESFADAMINSTLNAINSANLTYLIPYGHELNAVSSGFGLASLASVGLQVVWDYENYGKNTKDFIIASAITLAATVVTVALCSVVMTYCTPVVALIGTIYVGATIGMVSDDVKKRIIG